MSCFACKTLVKRFFLFACFTILGMFTFYFIERDHSKSFIKNRIFLRTKLQNKLQKQYNMSSKEIASLFDEFGEALQDNGLEWDYMNAHYFTVQLVTTIGYGNITPKTTLGRMIAILYAIIGIPIAALLFQTIGKILSGHQKTVLSLFERKILKLEGPIKHQAAKASVMTGFVAFSFFLCGAAHYRYVHGPNTYSDGIYVWFMTLTTVGFGDLIAAQPDVSNLLSVLQPLAMLLGLCVVSTALNNIADCFKEGYFNVDLCVCCCGKLTVQKVETHDDTKEEHTMKTLPA